VTESPAPNPAPRPAALTLGAVALGAYAAGRMKKGRTALRLALWASGARTDPRRLLREGLLQLINSAEGKLLVAQLRGPMLEAGRRAVGATIEGQLAALADTLEKRTAALTQATGDLPDRADQVVGQAGSAAAPSGVGEVTDLVDRRSRRKDRPAARQDTAEQDPADDEAPRSADDGHPDDEDVEDDEARAADDGHQDDEADDERDDEADDEADDEDTEDEEEYQDEQEPERTRTRARSDADEEEPGRRRGEARTRRTRDPEPAAGPAPSKRATRQGRAPRRPRKEGAR
jgi:hypothetical protein